NQLAIELTITLLSRNQAVNIDEDIKNIVQDNGFWEEVVEDHIKDILEKRWKSIYHPIMEVAHLLDPSFHGC
ncbi:11518_t:CDS:2, partial [Entrophospora sp. SA101]